MPWGVSVPCSALLPLGNTAMSSMQIQGSPSGERSIACVLCLGFSAHTQLCWEGTPAQRMWHGLSIYHLETNPQVLLNVVNGSDYTLQ